MKINSVIIFLLCSFYLTASTDDQLINAASFIKAQINARIDGNSYTVSEQAKPSFCETSLSSVYIPEQFPDGFKDKYQHLENDRMLPASFNWGDKVTPVRIQGDCGSCWAFGATGVMESAVLIKTGKIHDFSEQDLISCNRQGFTCNGGGVSILDDLRYGIALEEDYPYAAADTICRKDVVRKWKSTGWIYVEPEVSQIKTALIYYGPLISVVSSDESFQHYSGGIYNHDCDIFPNHIVVITGFDDNLGKSGVFLVKNCWGIKWGEKGFMRIEYDKSSIGSICAAVSGIDM